MADNMLDMGEYKSEFNDILGIQIESQTIYRSTGLPAHMVKRKHYKCLKYIDFIPDIIANPDYIGINPNEKGGESVEFIKKFGINVLVGVKLDSKNGYLYVSTVHDIQESKLQRRLHSGRIKALAGGQTEQDAEEKDVDE